MINPFSKVDMVKHSGRTVAVDLSTGDVIATAKEKRSLKYDKVKYTKVAILTIPVIEQPQAKLINRIAIVLDESGSMGDIKTKTIEVFNSILDSIKVESEKSGQETYISVFGFAYTAREIYVNKEVSKANKLDYFSYKTSGQTALFDGIGHAINKFKELPEDENTSYLVYVLTDGDENYSSKFSSSSIKNLFMECEKTSKYTITLQLPPGRKSNFCSRYGISSDNVREWTATNQGMEEVGTVTRQAFTNYYNARSMGATKVSNFYTDLSNVTSKDLNKLDDISNQVKIVEVPKECQIKEFVEEKTKKPYVIGQGYYQLMKKELVQAQKSVIIFDKKTKKTYSGPGARKLIGLPDGQSCKVEPLNHAGMEIFVKSTSVNRILPRGSKVLIDLMQSQPNIPTWS